MTFENQILFNGIDNSQIFCNRTKALYIPEESLSMEAREHPRANFTYRKYINNASYTVNANK